MKPAQRAALKSAIKRYTQANTTSKAAALAVLVKEGTHTSKGKITLKYGGQRKKKSDSAR